MKVNLTQNICIQLLIVLFLLYNNYLLTNYNLLKNEHKNLIIFTFANKLSCSFKYLEDNIAATMTLIAPNGVTTEAGAKAYAAKLNTSPKATKNKFKKK